MILQHDNLLLVVALSQKSAFNDTNRWAKEWKYLVTLFEQNMSYKEKQHNSTLFMNLFGNCKLFLFIHTSESSSSSSLWLQQVCSLHISVHFNLLARQEQSGSLHVRAHLQAISSRTAIGAGGPRIHQHTCTNKCKIFLIHFSEVSKWLEITYTYLYYLIISY